MSFWFGDFELDRERRQLLRSGQPVALEPKAYELLCLLVEFFQEMRFQSFWMEHASAVVAQTDHS